MLLAERTRELNAKVAEWFLILRVHILLSDPLLTLELLTQQGSAVLAAFNEVTRGGGSQIFVPEPVRLIHDMSIEG